MLVPPGPGKVAPSHTFMDKDAPYRPTKVGLLLDNSTAANSNSDLDK